MKDIEIWIGGNKIILDELKVQDSKWHLYYKIWFGVMIKYEVDKSDNSKEYIKQLLYRY